MQSQTRLLSPLPTALPRAHMLPRAFYNLDDSPQRSILVSDLSRPTSHPLIRSMSPSNPTVQPEPSALSSSSPPQIRHAPSFSPPHHLASSETSSHPDIDRYSIQNLATHLRADDKYAHNQQALLDQRRMSEPTMYGSTASGYPSNAADLSAARYHHLQASYTSPPPYPPHPSPLHRSSNIHLPSGSWKQDNRLSSHRYDSIELEEPLSPLNPTFSGGEGSPPMAISGGMFGSLHEDYGPSPPGTGTSTSSNTPITHEPTNTMVGPSSPSNTKQYSFVPLPGNGVRKRPRRRYDEIERLYHCSWQNCTKAYGTLNHLNAHITMQKHGPKRSPNEFKELRKQWRKAKKEEAEAKALDVARHASHPLPHPPQHHPSRHPMSDAEYQAHNIRHPFDYPERPIQPVGPLDDLHDSRHRSQRYGPFISPPLQQSAMPYPHSQAQGANTSNVPMNRLPTNSTLLTPLPGYGSIGGVPEFDTYNSYGLYRSDSRSRSSRPSPERHSDRGRPRLSHNWSPS